MAQKTVNVKLAFGIKGEWYDASVRRAENFKLADAVEFGKFVWVKTDGTATATYADGLALAGIVVSPKEHVAPDLTATLVAPAGETVACANMGRVIVAPVVDVKVGDAVAVVTTASTDGTNALGDIVTTGAALATGAKATAIAGAVFDIVDAKAGELAVIRLG